MPWLVLLLLLVTSPAFAWEVTFTWTANSDGTDGYRLLMDSGTNIVQEIPGRLTTTISYEIEEVTCHSFALLAYGTIDGKDEVSDLSDFAVVCPPKPTVIEVSDL